MAERSQSTLDQLGAAAQLPAVPIVIVRTDWNAAIVDRLEAGCLSLLRACGQELVRILRVPGVVEIPFAIKKFWDTHGGEHPAPAVFIALGCVIRGDTPHFDYVCRSVTDGITLLNTSLPVPTVFGVLTVDNEQQALERVGGVHGHKGEEAAMTALKMMSLVGEMASMKFGAAS